MASKEQDKGKIGKGKKITVRGVVRDVQVAADDVLIFSKAGHVSRRMPMEGHPVLNVRL